MARVAITRLTDTALPGVDGMYKVTRKRFDGVSQLPTSTEGFHASLRGATSISNVSRSYVWTILSPPSAWAKRASGRAVMESISRMPARRLARQILTYDIIVGESGLGREARGR